MPIGICGFQKGYKPTEETRKKQVEKLMGNQRTLGKHWKLSDEVRKKHSLNMIGNTRSKGNIPWNKGMKGFLAGEKHPGWKGENSKKRIIEKERLKIAGIKPEKCELCKKGGKIVFDHDHKTGEFRGWICHNCNVVLGLVNDDIEVLKLMVKYLTKITAQNPVINNKRYFLRAVK